MHVGSVTTDQSRAGCFDWSACNVAISRSSVRICWQTSSWSAAHRSAFVHVECDERAAPLGLSADQRAEQLHTALDEFQNIFRISWFMPEFIERISAKRQAHQSGECSSILIVWLDTRGERRRLFRSFALSRRPLSWRMRVRGGRCSGPSGSIRGAVRSSITRSSPNQVRTNCCRLELQSRSTWRLRRLSDRDYKCPVESFFQHRKHGPRERPEFAAVSRSAAAPRQMR